MRFLGKGDGFKFERKKRLFFYAYDGFMDRIVKVKVSFENFDVKTFMPMWDL